MKEDIKDIYIAPMLMSDGLNLDDDPEEPIRDSMGGTGTHQGEINP